MKILSFQSAVAFGCVGNSAAVFPLQRLGVEVLPVDTVQLSNHPGLGGFGGDAHEPGHLRSVVEGLGRLGELARLDGVLSGYLGTPGAGDALVLAVQAMKRANPSGLFLCDPVMGETDKGLYVRPGIPAFFQTRAVPLADVVTPNSFELNQLTGLPAGTVAEAARAARTLLECGPRLVVATGVDGANTLAVTREAAWVVRTPLLPFRPSGAGDLLAALLMARLLAGDGPAEALSWAVSGLYGVLDASLALGRTDLALVAAQDEFVEPTHRFPTEPLALDDN
jgi:pyridoxine kinase